MKKLFAAVALTMNGWKMMFILSALTLFTGSSLAADLKTALILNFPGDTLRQSMTTHVIAALAQAGFEDRQNVRILQYQPQSTDDGIMYVQQTAPDVVIELSYANQVREALAGTSVPYISDHLIEPYLDANDMPLHNITGVHVKLQDMVYNAHKFLSKVAPLKPGQQAVFLQNPAFDLITKAEVEDALHRLNVPLKAVVDTHVYEDFQEAVLRYNADPDIGWFVVSVWPTVKRDGSTLDLFNECAPWGRTHMQKPFITYWDISVQQGALGAFGVDLDDVGRQCGEMAARILNGEPVAQIRAEYPRTIFVSLNRKTADFLGITFSLDVLKLANVIYNDYEGHDVIRK